MFQGVMIIVVFFILALLMMLRKIPTFLAMILMSILICVIARVPMVGTKDGVQIGWLQTILEAGSTRMASAITAIVFGSWLGQLMNRTGVTETIIKKSAELGGDRPLVVAIVLMVANALLFTTLSGLGSVIMVGSIILPILLSVGIPSSTAACILLMSFNVGLTFNMVNWQGFASIFSLDIPTIQRFEIYMLVTTAIAALIFVLVEFRKNGKKFAFAAPVNANAGGGGNSSPEDTRPIKGFSGACALISPIIPILLVLILKWPVIPAFIAGIVWILIFTMKSFSKSMNLLAKTCYDGFTAAAPALILFISLGMMIVAVMNPIVKEILNPFLLAVIPSSRIPFIIFFALLAPLSLYRGPLNLFGLGSGIAALIIGLGTLNPLAVMGAFLSAERIQGCGDPTNTQNVWTANFCEVDVNGITKTLLPYLWIIAVIGVIITGTIFF